MTKHHTDSPEFNVYEFDISLTLRRKIDRYSNDELAKVRVERTVPLRDDMSAKLTMAELATEELNRILEVTEARIDFEDRVKQLLSGDTIDAELDAS